jgi:hypothetical protein
MLELNGQRDRSLERLPRWLVKPLRQLAAVVDIKNF